MFASLHISSIWRPCGFSVLSMLFLLYCALSVIDILSPILALKSPSKIFVASFSSIAVIWYNSSMISLLTEALFEDLGTRYTPHRFILQECVSIDTHVIPSPLLFIISLGSSFQLTSLSISIVTPPDPVSLLLFLFLLLCMM